MTPAFFSDVTLRFIVELHFVSHVERRTPWQSPSWNSLTPQRRKWPKISVACMTVNSEDVLDTVLHINWNLVAFSVTQFACDPRRRKLHVILPDQQIILIRDTQRLRNLQGSVWHVALNGLLAHAVYFCVREIWYSRIINRVYIVTVTRTRHSDGSLLTSRHGDLDMVTEVLCHFCSIPTGNTIH